LPGTTFTLKDVNLNTLATGTTTSTTGIIDFNITSTGVYFVENCEWIMDIMNRVDPDDYESLQYFERVLRQTGIIKALEDAGINEGDTVNVYDVEFDFVP